ncbi:MAG TPA: ABC transporter permease [Methanomicrobiales archaeon]|nr:ABC transporter permease [Methanomicrobiales archaeon]
MSYLIFVAGFGALATYLLWFRDVRIFFRTGLPGYRAAARHGVAYATLALIGVDVGLIFDEVVGLGLILLALYLQGREKREKVFSGGEPALDRLLGKTAQRKDKERE